MKMFCFTLIFLSSISFATSLQCSECNSQTSWADCVRTERVIDCNLRVMKTSEVGPGGNMTCIKSEVLNKDHNGDAFIVYEKKCGTKNDCREERICNADGYCKFSCCQSDCLTKASSNANQNTFNTMVLFVAPIFALFKFLL